MQNVIKCSFCQKPQGMVRDEIVSHRTLSASICPDCLNVCRSILKKEIKSGAESGNYKVSASRRDPAGPLCCSFCDTPQEIVDKLIGSPRGSAPAYICDKCVDAGARTIEKNTGQLGSPRNLWHWIARKFGIRNSQLRHTLNY